MLYKNVIYFEKINDDLSIQEIGEKSRAKYRHLFINDTHFENLSNVTGYNQSTRKKGIIFHLINKADGSYKEVKNKDGSTQKKSERRGGVCGQATGAKKKSELIDLINYILNKLQNGYDPKYLQSKNIPNKVKTSKNLGKSLCEEIEILLRHLEWESSDVTSNNRYFYRIEEKEYINNYS